MPVELVQISHIVMGLVIMLQQEIDQFHLMLTNQVITNYAHAKIQQMHHSVMGLTDK